MVTIFIKILSHIVILYIFFYVISFSIYEIKTQKNKLGGIATIIFTLITCIGNIISIIQN